MQHINLLDPRLLPPQRALPGAQLVALMAAATLAVAGHYLVERHAMAQLVAAPAAEAAPGDETASLEPGAVDATATLAHQLAQREALRTLLQAGTEASRDSAALIQAVVAALPESLWLTELDITAAGTLRVSGGALEPAALVGFADHLSRVPALRRLPIETLRLEPLPATSGAAEPAGNPGAHRFVLASAGAPAAGAAP